MADIVIERMYTGFCEQSNAINAAAEPDVKRKDMAGFYADCLRAHALKKPVDFKAVNNAILARWPKGLEWIKTQAWKELEAANA